MGHSKLDINPEIRCWERIHWVYVLIAVFIFISRTGQIPVKVLWKHATHKHSLLQQRPDYQLWFQMYRGVLCVVAILLAGEVKSRLAIFILLLTIDVILILKEPPYFTIQEIS